MLLKSVIPQVAGACPDPMMVREFVYYCHRLASVYLRRKVASGRLSLHVFNLTLDDLALDSIADLFQRDESNSFPRLRDFFSSAGLPLASEEECISLVRQLVFSEVNRHLFRLYRENDPSLGKIIRNLKNAIKSLSDVSIERLGDELWIYVLSENESDAPVRVIRPEVLETHLASRVPPGAPLKDILTAFREILCEDDHYAKRFPLAGLALIVRSALARTSTEHGGQLADEDTFADGDMRILVGESVRAVKERMRTSYLGRGKLDAHTYDALFAAVHDILVAQYVCDDGYDVSFCQRLQKHLSVETMEEYQRRYRVYVEYFNKLVRRELLDAARRELR